VKSGQLLFKCSIDHAVFFRFANALYDKVDRTASEEVTLELIRSKCILVCGLECFLLLKSDLKSLYFAVTRFLMKLFRTSSTEVITDVIVILDSPSLVNS